MVELARKSALGVEGVETIWIKYVLVLLEDLLRAGVAGIC